MNRPSTERALAALAALLIAAPAIAADPGSRAYPGYGYAPNQYMWRPMDPAAASATPTAQPTPPPQTRPATPAPVVEPPAALPATPSPALAPAPAPAYAPGLAARSAPAPAAAPLSSAPVAAAPRATATAPSVAPSQPTAVRPGQEYPAAAPFPPGVQIAETRLGRVLADQDGRTLYINDRDAAGMSFCRGECARLWRPLVTGEVWSMPEGFSLVQTADTQRQWAWHGRPLFRFAGDQAPGEVGGDGLDGIWHAARTQ